MEIQCIRLRTEARADCLQSVTARPGARFGPGGIRQGSRRMAAPMGWSVYTGKQAAYEYMVNQMRLK